MFRRAMKRAVGNAMRLGCQGIKIRSWAADWRCRDCPQRMVSRRPRAAAYLRADIDYGTAEAKTTYGIIGVKVWVLKGEIMEPMPRAAGKHDRASSGKPKEQSHVAAEADEIRKQQKGRNRGLATIAGDKVSFGEYGLKATDRGPVTARQIEAARRAITRHVKRGGKIWIRIFPGQADH
jgi:hypothetical protein